MYIIQSVACLLYLKYLKYVYFLILCVIKNNSGGIDWDVEMLTDDSCNYARILHDIKLANSILECC